MWRRFLEEALFTYFLGTLISIVIGVIFGLWLYFCYL